MPKGPVQTPITDQEIAYAHLLLAGTMTDKQAAKAVAIDPSRAAYVKGKPKVQAYMEEHRASVRAGLVQHEVEALAKFNISREQILAKWWQFGNLDPALGHNTSSQSKALELLWKGLGYAEAEPQKPKEGGDEEDQKPKIYVAAWMRKPGDPDYENDEGLDAELGVVNPAENRPEPPPMPARPVVVPQPPTVRPGSNTMNHAVGPVQSTQNPGGNFGRFQGL